MDHPATYPTYNWGYNLLSGMIHPHGSGVSPNPRLSQRRSVAEAMPRVRGLPGHRGIDHGDGVPQLADGESYRYIDDAIQITHKYIHGYT